MLGSRASAHHLQGCAGQGARGRRPVVAPQLRSSYKEEASSNQARVEEVLQKKLSRKTNLGQGGGQVGHSGPQSTRDTQGNGAGTNLSHAKAENKCSSLSAQDLLAFERQGHFSTRGVLSETQVLKARQAAEQAIEARSAEALQHRIRVLLPEHHHIAVTSEQQGLEHLKTHRKEVGFLQHFNLHR